MSSIDENKLFKKIDVAPNKILNRMADAIKSQTKDLNSLTNFAWQFLSKFEPRDILESIETKFKDHEFKG